MIISVEYGGNRGIIKKNYGHLKNWIVRHDRIPKQRDSRLVPEYPPFSPAALSEAQDEPVAAHIWG